MLSFGRKITLKLAICNDYNPYGVMVVVMPTVPNVPVREMEVVKYLLLLTFIYLQM